MEKTEKLYDDGFEQLKRNLQNIVDMFNPTDRNYSKAIGCFAMLENYAKEAKEKLLQDASCKDMFYDEKYCDCADYKVI